MDINEIEKCYEIEVAPFGMPGLLKLYWVLIDSKLITTHLE
jgi:hypothetical protein